MSQAIYVYRVFPSEIISNTFDCDVRLVEHDRLLMRGVFSRRMINPSERSVFMEVYHGHFVKNVGRSVRNG